MVHPRAQRAFRVSGLGVVSCCSHLRLTGFSCELTRGKAICELGGGMAALAGVVAAAVGKPSKMVLTEGNPQCVANLQEIIEENSPPVNPYFGTNEPGKGIVTSRQILWDTNVSYAREFDVIFVADCLYAIDVQDSLLHVIKQSLLPKGSVYIMAPKRGKRYLRTERKKKTISSAKKLPLPLPFPSQL